MNRLTVTPGTLYAVGVGPGAPDLVTLRAAHILGGVDAVLAASSSGNDYSSALNIALPHLRADAEIVRLNFPMTRRRGILRKAWTQAANQALAVLRTGKSAAFLTIGDPLVYSTFGYLLREVRKKAPEQPVEIVPGITSFQAAAARAEFILCEGDETLRLLPGINDAEELERELRGADTAVILKVYRNIAGIGRALRDAGRDSGCLLASRVEQSGECISKGLPPAGETPPYMSLILSAGRAEKNPGQAAPRKAKLTSNPA
ncbi:MAG: precorrin-2 C(20)-methyltransferase [Desulfovibrio sp.]|jgi:precorrin-2/cobalt-factor-2 C20-methyltransferase|nr:precorrin-2 C(20)-methyltransferase [Desulfovibrio sp.]